MALQDLTSRDAVLAAIAEFREIGREAFLQKYGYGEARSYFLSFEGELFDSKAIVGAAYGFQHGKPLANTAFSGGDATVRAKLRSLAFNVVSLKDASAPAKRPLPSLEPGRIYSWDELGKLFACEPNYFSSVGGMASRPEMQALLLITHIGGAKSFDYEDYREGNELIYTGRGKTGDQRMDGQNKLLATNRYTNFVFEGAATRLLRFLGIARSTQHWWSTGTDSNGTQRRIIRFRLTFSERAGVGATTAAPTAASRRARMAPTLMERPFDETRLPAAPVLGGERRSPEETLALQEKAVQGHFDLVAALNRALLSRGWRDVREIPKSVDLWGRRPGDGRRVIFEVKTLGQGSEVDLTRAALSQLLEYRHFRGKPDDLLCLVMNAPVSDARERFLRAQGVAVLTYDGTSFEPAGPLALEMVGTLVE
ncbi:hypothetical protein [Corallococcus sp. EGB]|uniref:hypothetical protein n=1 Tax=Corallococcus sp. EGB TaxID=1521117 RepID=UPI001CBF36CC|nr:hypothetical protein [Corallococcus sp. EGB]